KYRKESCLANLDELLLTVQRPGRYVGGEWNAVKKEWTEDKVKFLLAFPDVYEIGMSHLGIKILYGILNDRQDVLCERVFAPWPDLEKVLRDNGIPLFSLESRKALKEFDIIGFSLAYELGYTNVINMIDQGGIPIRSSDRSDSDPIVIAGGPCCYNPEPMADFIDAFVIGDGEDVIGEIIDAYSGAKRGAGYSRKGLLQKLAAIEGVYVPSLYKVVYNEDKTIKSFSASGQGVPERIRKRSVKDLDEAYYPTKQIVPNIQVVHDRITIEIMRGCRHACSFCEAQATYRPCRERSKAKILELARMAYDDTGYDEISLLSLSSGDHSEIIDIVKQLNKEFKDLSVSVSLPSLRVEDILKHLPTLISEVKKSGLTFAPEAGSARLREVINKRIDIDKLFAAVRESFRMGWRRVKLYFMIGLPSENDVDIAEISALVSDISNLRREVDSRPANVAVSVNAFIPKPHTLFEREGMESRESLFRKKELLQGAIRLRSIELSFHPVGISRLEAVFSRGDRRLGEVILLSWSYGARFDGWQEIFAPDLWSRAFASSGVDPDFYSTRPRAREEKLPWEFIEIR
ncbi:MAG: TIGR03960 family B12-binding radical SAM protein, partial [Candidatus Omnitrophica bacterium]|nr:TIGR03960 family B12-binding radical SAM protein [Candidatus Omnitrophota bacterium]